MTRYSPEVEADISRRSRIFGIILGSLCIFSAPIGGALGTCCPLGSFVGVVPVFMGSFLAGWLAAMFLNWGNVPPEASMGVGVKVGMQTGFMASVIGAGLTFIVSTFLIGILGTTITGIGLQDDAGRAIAGGAAMTLTSIISNLLVMGVSIGFGTVFGIVGGVFGAALKRPSK